MSVLDDTFRCVILASGPKAGKEGQIKKLVDEIGGVNPNALPAVGKESLTTSFTKLQLTVYARRVDRNPGLQDGGNGTGGDGAGDYGSDMLISHSKAVLFKEVAYAEFPRVPDTNPQIAKTIKLPKEMAFEIAIYQPTLKAAHTLLANKSGRFPVHECFDHVMIVTLNTNLDLGTQHIGIGG
jgi:hypothetical protein